ncbi:oxidoreductase [Enhygromyxa salina]|uniref:Putative ketoacyl reductase n=1 Tax=Enhygromyxa salina TaxID=215803 RepID=A0A2S9YDH9_9BACT|nr:oxidoreductase [Enhygromyxa salina]PRQ03163.1 putative ketoacyl reductase [Enhygromyxa salina]
MTSFATSSTVALVTGASSGIGKATARQLLADGLTVYVAARRVEKMADLALAGAIPLGMDITKDDEVVAAIRQIEADHGGVDVLVNNAGYAVYGAVEDIDIETARRQFEVNLFGLARLTQLVLPHMRRKGAGRIINMSSMGGKIYTPLGAWYHATKHALEGWSDCLRIELAPFGIEVVIVEPGGIKTEFGDVMGGPMLEHSGQGAYAELAHTMATATTGTYENASGPEVIAKVVAKAVRARRPRTRYVAGYMARPLLFMRRWLSDRMFDRVITSAAG